MTPAAKPQLVTNLQRRLSQIGLITIFITVATLSAAKILTISVMHDEHMYLSAASLVAEKSIYTDFSYLQMPYMPFVYSMARKIGQSDKVLLAARVTKIFIVVCLLLALFGFARSLSNDQWFAMATTVLVFENDIFLHNIGYARNYDLPLLLILLSGWVSLLTVSSQWFRPALFFSGLLVAAAIGTKLTFALVPLAFVLMLYAQQRQDIKAVFSSVFYFLCGLAIGLLPVFVILLEAGIERIWFNNLGYHHLNMIWRQESDFTGPMSFSEKLSSAVDWLSSSQSRALILILLLLAFFSLLRFISGKALLKRSELIWCSSLCLIAVIMFFVPTPVWRSYLSPLVVFLTLLAAILFSQANRHQQTILRLLTLVTAAALFSFNWPTHRHDAAAALQADQWTGNIVHREASFLRAKIPLQLRQQPVATLSPLHAIEANLKIYPELATGPFTYRVGDYVADNNLETFGIVSPGALYNLLEQQPPSAILVGYEDELDQQFEDYAVSHGYALHVGWTPDGKLYIPTYTDQ